MDKKLPTQYRRAFKDADIRGVYQKEIDDDLAYFVARAFVEEFGYTKVLIGSDMRLSSPALSEAFARGVVDAGAVAMSVGLVSSPMLYFASGSMKLPGVMITASHSPADYNGMKLVAPEAVPLTKPTGLTAIQKRVTTGVFKAPKKKGKRMSKDIHAGYQKFVLKNWPIDDLSGIKIVADAGNGMSNVVLPLLSEKLPLSFKVLAGELDGTFPSRGSDPTLRKNQKNVTKELKAKKYDFGISFDGDADRIAFLDEKGSYVNCASIGALVAERLLQKKSGQKIVFTNLTSRVYEESVTEAGGEAIRARVGHAFIKRKMRDTGAVFGCEHSGHFYFKDFFYTDSVVLTLRYVLEAYIDAKNEKKTFSEMMKPYLLYQQLEDVVIEVENKKKAIAEIEKYIKKEFPEAIIKKFDGLYVDFGDVWGAVKLSVTEHAVKIMFEGKKKASAKAVQERLVAYAKTIAFT